jgi:hypothetical protein
LNTITRPVYNDRVEFRIISGGELLMDGKNIQSGKASGVSTGPFEIRSLPARGFQTVGGREHEMLVAEGHYRCPDCRRADLNEKHVTTTRMR